MGKVNLTISRVFWSILVVGCLTYGSGGLSAKTRLDLRHQSLEIPGAPAVVLPTDLNSDGVQDLVVALAYTEWDQIEFEESTEMRGLEGLVMVMTVIPALMDRRELRVFLGTGKGGYDETVPALPIDLSVLTLDHGLPDSPVIVLTDTGVSSLRLQRHETGYGISLEPLFETTPVMARSGTLIPNLGLSRDLNNDGRRDLMIPVEAGFAIHLAMDDSSYSDDPIRIRLPGSTTAPRKRLARYFPLPVVRDVDGDELVDLLVPDRYSAWDDFALLTNRGNGEFATEIWPVEGLEVTSDDLDETVVHFGDLDGDGVAEYLTEEGLEDPEAGWRKEIKEAKRPPRRYRVYRSESDLSRAPEPVTQFEATGYAFDLKDADIRLPGGFKDLDGDGRQDLITMTLDFSLLQAVRVLTTQRIGLGLDFYVWCQDDEGRFRAVPELDLSGKFKVNLKNLQLSQLSQFAGDFDGDNRIDFLQVGRGKTVTIHRGQNGCRYPAAPDLTIRLEDPPLDLGLVKVLDLDADGLADLMITQPQDQSEPGVTAPVRLDLYLSGETR